MNGAKIFWVVFLFSASSAFAQQVPSELIHYPDSILYNGIILTIDDNFSVVQAIAMREGKILAVGSDDEVLRFAGPGTEKINLMKKTVMPGIIDTHVHSNRSALGNYITELPVEFQRLRRARGRITKWDSKDQVLQDIRNIVQRTDPLTPWVLINTKIGGLNHPVAKQVTRQDLDLISPDRPLFLSTDAMEGIVNSQVVDMLVSTYGDNLPGLIKGEDGQPNGQVIGAPFYIIGAELMPQIPAQILAPLYRKELIEHWAPVGQTTFSTRLNANEARAYVLLDLEGKMPTRLAYGLEVGRWNPLFERDMRRGVSALPGHGTDRVWFNSITVALPDESIPEGNICSTYEKRNLISEFDLLPEGRCYWTQPGDPSIETVRELSRLGFRVANIHTFGDKGTEIAVDLFEELGVGGRRFALDHTVMFNERVIRKSGQLGMYWSVSASKFQGDLSILAGGYGREMIDRWTFPLQELVDAGNKVTYEGSSRRGDTTPFYDMEMFVTRKDGDGKIWGFRNALDRSTVLKMMTRWGAEYVLREDKIGTLEPGKYADLLILDQNPLDRNLPDEDLSEIKILVTMVEGEILYERPDSGL